jgi:PPK2 family polyphosphate:nucleotide phosphotransferase
MAKMSDDAKRRDYVTPFRIGDPASFRLKAHVTDATGDLDKGKAEKIIEKNRERLSELQEKLYAQDLWSVLLVFQAMDAAGKDSAIEHVMHGINPQGCDVVSFKTPSSKELDHDFLWRHQIALPERGRIGVFNRSHYEEVLVVRVHPEFLAKQKVPPRLITRNIWRERFEDIRDWERYLARNGTLVLKFFLNVSKEEQRERFLDRLEDPAKRWKFSMGDVGERALWDKYMAAYQDMVRHTSTREAPWHVVPADHKWFARVIIGSTIIEAMEKLDLRFPKVDKGSLREFDRVREALEQEARGPGAKAANKAGKKADKPAKGKKG